MKMQKLLIFLCLCVLIHADDQCPSGTKWLQLPDGTWDCLVCNDCPRGMIKVHNCSLEHDTKCKACDDHSYYNDTGHKCTSCSGCPQGGFIKSTCSQFLDSVCEPCPNGTFSSTANSSSCTNCTACVGDYSTECNSTHNAVCILLDEKDKSGSVGGIIVAVVGVLVAVMMMVVVYIFMYRQRRFCWSRHSSDRSAGYSVATQDTGDVPSLSSKSMDRKEASKETKYNHLDFIKRLKKKQMERESDLKQLKSIDEQLKKLSSSVGVLVCPKPVIKNTSKEEEDVQKAGVSKLAVCRVGSKYIMTAYFPLRDMFGTADGEDLTYSIFDEQDVYVAFDETNISSSNRKFKICASKPAYTNTVLDIIMLEIYDPSFETSTTETKTKMTEEMKISPNFPPPFCLHTSISTDNVFEIDVQMFDKDMEKKELDKRSFLIKSKTEPLKQASKYLSDHADVLNRSINKPGNENFVQRSILDLAEIGQTKICWTTKTTKACVGCPGIIHDKGDGYCKLLCICTGRVPKILDDLPLKLQEPFTTVKSLRTGTLMSEVYKKMKIAEPTLAMELFYEFNEDQKVQ